MNHPPLSYRGHTYRRVAGSNGYSVYRISRGTLWFGSAMSKVEARRAIDRLCDFIEPYKDPERVVAGNFSAAELRNLP